MKTEKVACILGGMGPYATVDSFAAVLSCTPVTRQGEHLRIIIDNNVKIPSRSRAILCDEENFPLFLKIEICKDFQ